MTEWLTMTILLAFAGLRIVHVSRQGDDTFLGALLVAAGVARLAVGMVNHYLGPLPGAQIDAVMFEETAQTMAAVPGSPVNFAIEVGKYGYSSILAVVYLVAGTHFLIPTVINLLFVVEFLILVHGLVAEWGDPGAARLAVAVAAFYPTSLIYTAVPLREAPLMFAFALFVRTLVDYHAGRRVLFHPRMIFALGLLVWLHDGFALAVFLIPIAIWFRYDRLTVLQRMLILAVGMAAIVAAFAVALTFLDMSKMPEDPGLLLDPSYLARMREVKSAYGVGYGAFEPTWGGILRTAPLLLFAFVAAPFPIWWTGLGEFPKVLEGLLSLCIVMAALFAVYGLRVADRKLRMLLACYLFMVFVFAMGTGNTGIAARHRAKFIWMPVGIVLVVFRSTRAADATVPERARA